MSIYKFLSILKRKVVRVMLNTIKILLDILVIIGNIAVIVLILKKWKDE